MLRRRAQQSTRNSVSTGRLRCKRCYTVAAAKSVEASKHNGFNSFISKSAPASELEHDPEYQEDAHARAQKSGPEVQNLIAVKDNIATTSLRTTCGSGILRDYRSPVQASVIKCLIRRRFRVYGKTNLDEFGMGSHSTHSFFGPVCNVSPFEALSAGGSSGGSAAAVASGECLIALGTDTGGSVRLPAGYTGAIGFKPSYGMISRCGVVPYANSMDTVGIIAREVPYIKRTFSLTRKHDPKDPTSVSDEFWARVQRDKSVGTVGTEDSKMTEDRAGEKSGELSGVRIGVPVEYNIEELEPCIRQAWTNCLRTLRDLGATIVPVSLPNTRHALSAYYVLAPAEAASNLSKYDGVRYGTRDGGADGAEGVLYSRTRGDGFGAEVRRRILLGSYTLSSEAINNYFMKAQQVRRLVQRDFDRIFATPNPLRPSEQFDLKDMDESIQMSSKLGPSQVDFLVCPTAPTLPPTLDNISKQMPIDTYMNDVFTVPASLAGIPAISIPFPISEDFHGEGKPAFAGMQLIGQYASDHELLNIAGILAMCEGVRELTLKDGDSLQQQDHEPNTTPVKASRKGDKQRKRHFKVSKFVSIQGADSRQFAENLVGKSTGEVTIYRFLSETKGDHGQSERKENARKAASTAYRSIRHTSTDEGSGTHNNKAPDRSHPTTAGKLAVLEVQGELPIRKMVFGPSGPATYRAVFPVRTVIPRTFYPSETYASKSPQDIKEGELTVRKLASVPKETIRRFKFGPGPELPKVKGPLISKHATSKAYINLPDASNQEISNMKEDGRLSKVGEKPLITTYITSKKYFGKRKAGERLISKYVTAKADFDPLQTSDGDLIKVTEDDLAAWKQGAWEDAK